MDLSYSPGSLKGAAGCLPGPGPYPQPHREEAVGGTFPGETHLLQGGLLARVLLMQPFHQALHHAGLHVQQDVPPVVAGHHAVLQQEQ